MRAVLQRVRHARVEVDSRIVGAIGPGADGLFDKGLGFFAGLFDGEHEAVIARSEATKQSSKNKKLDCFATLAMTIL